MALYLARHQNYSLVLGTGKQQILEDELGNKRLVEVIPGLSADFGPEALTSRCVEVATQLWFSGPPGFEDKATLPLSAPGIHREIIVNEDGSGTLGRELYFKGSRKENYLSAYDSSDPRHYIPIKVKGEALTPDGFTALVDQLLQNHRQFGADFVKVDAVRLPAPWATYDEIKGAAGAKTIRETIVGVTRNADAVIAYENQRQDGPRKMYVDAALDAKRELEAMAQEQAALEVSQ